MLVSARIIALPLGKRALPAVNIRRRALTCDKFGELTYCYPLWDLVTPTIGALMTY